MTTPSSANAGWPRYAVRSAVTSAVIGDEILDAITEAIAAHAWLVPHGGAVHVDGGLIWDASYLRVDVAAPPDRTDRDVRDEVRRVADGVSPGRLSGWLSTLTSQGATLPQSIREAPGVIADSALATAGAIGATAAPIVVVALALAALLFAWGGRK